MDAGSAGKNAPRTGKTDIHPFMTALLDKLLYSCFLFDLHHPTDDPVTDVTTSAFVLFLVFFSPAMICKIISVSCQIPMTKDYYCLRLHLEI